MPLVSILASPPSHASVTGHARVARHVVTRFAMVMGLLLAGLSQLPLRAGEAPRTVRPTGSQPRVDERAPARPAPGPRHAAPATRLADGGIEQASPAATWGGRL